MVPKAQFAALLLPVILVADTTSTAIAQNDIRASSPAEPGTPVWSRVVPMPDGRKWVTDGGLIIDTAVAKPAVLPSTTLQAANGEIMARNFTATFTAEVRLTDLELGSMKNTFKTPTGITLNGNYVNFLRRVVNPAATRLQLRGPMDPIVVVTDGRPVAIMMPVASVR